MEILSVIALLAGIIGFFAFDLPSKVRDLYYAVYLTPKSILVDKSEWSTIKTVEIVNNNPHPIYSVQLEISEANAGSNMDNLMITPRPHIVSTSYSTTTDMNAFVISGRSNLTGKKWKQSIIYEIGARSAVPIQVTIPASSRSEKFILRITDYGRESNSIHEQEGATLIKFDIKK
ncbi:MAG: hypothetical protein WC761_04595 [Candidatus Paceibacterota bacterium]